MIDILNIVYFIVLSLINGGVAVMDIKKYLNSTAVYEEYLGKEEETETELFGEAVTIPVFQYGKVMFIRDTFGNTQLNAKAYVTTYPIKNESKIDGQIIRGIYEVPKFDSSSLEMVEAYTYKNAAWL